MHDATVPAVGLDRKTAPPLHWGERVDVPAYIGQTLPNGVELCSVFGAGDPAVRLMLYFPVDPHRSYPPLCRMAAMELMPRGTVRRSEQQVFDAMDSWGMMLQCDSTHDYCLISLQCLRDRFAESLELLYEILTEPAYAEEELRSWQLDRKVSLQASLQQPSTLATRGVFQSLFPDGHPYGCFAVPDDCDRLTGDVLREFHAHYIGSANCTLIYAGAQDDEILDCIKSKLGTSTWGQAQRSLIDNGIWPSGSGEPLVKTVSVQQNQAAVRLGRLLPARTHLDYVPLDAAVTLLGGYFGSRLISNLREEHGFTYGVSAFISFRRHGILVQIYSEIGNQYLVEAVRQIQYELERLQHEVPSEQELEEVKASMLGEALRRYDGAFRSASALLSQIVFPTLPATYPAERLQALWNLTGEDFCAVAREWLSPSDFTLSVSGAADVIDPVQWPTSCAQ